MAINGNDRLYGVGFAATDYREPTPQERPTEMVEYRHRIAGASSEIHKLINQMDGFFGRLYGDAQSVAKDSEKPISAGHHGLVRDALNSLDVGIGVLKDRIARLQEHG